MPRPSADDDGDDPLRRRQNKAATKKPQSQPGLEEMVKKDKPKDRLDYSRFNDIGKDSVEERAQTGDIVWSDLNKEEKKQVWQAEDQMEELLEKKRREEDEWRRQLRDKPADLSWCEGKHFATYEAFCTGRAEATLKKAGNEAFKRGDLDEAQKNWNGAIEMLLALGTIPPEAKTLICVLRNNLAQLHMKQRDYNKVKVLTDKILHEEPTNEKALFRRAQAFTAMSMWDKAEMDLTLLLKHHPDNKDGEKQLNDVQRKLGRDNKRLGGKAVRDIAAGMLELVPDGTVRKLRIEEYGDGDPDERADWIKNEWLEKGTEKCVVTCQMIITTHGGDELYNSREYRPFPETKQARDELKEYMEMVNFLDEEAKKKPRLVGDFYAKVKKRPVRWYLGDPGMYKGFDLAARTMKLKERALFEVDQPMLAASVVDFYKKLGFHSTLAGLPQLTYHIEEERLAILEDEIPEHELDLDNKTQRGVKVELQLLSIIVYKDVSPNGDAAKLHGVLHPGLPDAPPLERGELVTGGFFITRPFDGSLLVQNLYCSWRLGVDEGLYGKSSEENEPLRPDGGPFVPRCVADALLSVDWGQLRYGCLVEVRLRVGPELHEIAPQHAKQFEAARRDNHKKGKHGGAPCSIMVQIFPPDYMRPPEQEQAASYQTANLQEQEQAEDLEID